MYRDIQTVMSRELLSKIEAGCYGKMKFENGKIIFECVTTTNTVHHPPPSVPAPSAPPLVEDTLIIDELRDELRETKDRLALLEQQVQQLFRFREAVSMPIWIPRVLNDPVPGRDTSILYNFNVKTVRFIPYTHTRISKHGAMTYTPPSYNIILGDSELPLFPYVEKMADIIYLLKSQLRNDMTNHIIVQPYQTITPDCGVIVKFIVDWMTTSPNNNQITIMNPGATLATGFVVGLCEQLNPNKLSKLIITQAKISEQTEIRNKVDKTLFKKIEFEKVVSSV
jgi:hypothetical protein